jgi:predicted restriction endonuclease
MVFNSDVKYKIVRDKNGEHLPCMMCGVTYPLPDAVHIIDEKEWKAAHNGCDRQVNGIPLCPNCHRVFDEVLRPYLYRALSEFGANGLPTSWAKNNKVTVTEQPLDIGDKPKSTSARTGE